MTPENGAQRGKADNKSREEKLAVDQFIEYYNKVTEIKYQFKCRPEDKADPISKQVNGTHDFEYVPENGQGPTLAIELGGFYKSEDAVRNSQIARKFIRELHDEFSKKITTTKAYSFTIKFSRPPLKPEFDSCKSQITELAKNMISQVQKSEGEVSRLLKLGDDLKINCRLDTIQSKGSGIDVWHSLDEWGGEQKVEEISANSFLNALRDNHEKLSIPKKEGKRTILLVPNNYNGYIFAEPEVIKNLFPGLPDFLHINIDEIYFLNEKEFFNNFEIWRIK